MFALLNIIFLLCISAAATTFNGLTLSVLWIWFIVPTFKVPVLSIPVAIGIALIVGLLTARVAKKDNQDAKAKAKDGNHGELIGSSFATPLMILFVGWIVHLFM